ncbi:MAG TPA: poly-gamma-glutamate hydrolase family protein, partial [Nitrososphaera sp.]
MKRHLRRNNTIETSYYARLIPNKDRISERPRREHCSANSNQIDMMGLTPGQQVRIERPTENGTTFALYTIDAYDEEEGEGEEEPDNAVYVGYTEIKDLEDRLDLSSADSFPGTINAQVAAVGLTDAEAVAYSEFVEHLADNDYNRELVVIAPHGGFIEEHTDTQAQYLAQQLPSNCVSVWLCKGFKKGGGAFGRWHITSTDINEESFPMLKTIYGRHFKYAIAFHGWGGDSICIGGSSEDPDNLKYQIKKEIKKVVPDSIAVDIAGESGTCPEDFNGNEQSNIVNRLGITGVQIEQCSKARDDYGSDIAKAVANVM